MNNLVINEEKLRDLYLRNLSLGNIQGPLTNIPDVDKKWLRYYSEKQILTKMPEQTIYNYMAKGNIEHDKDIAINYFGKKITYKEFFKKIDECANSLLKSNVNPGDIITICMPNTPEAVIAFYAINKIGAVANIIHPLSGQNEIRDYINEVESKMVITIDMAYNKVLNILDQTNIKKIVTVSPADSMSFLQKEIYPHTKNYVNMIFEDKMVKWDKFIKNGKLLNDDNIAVYPYKKDNLAVILHTGGTTGTPKGVMLTNDNFNSMVEQFMQDASNFERGDKMLTIMPVFHGFGLCSSIHLPLSAGVTTILVPKLDAKKLDKTMNKYKPNHIIGVPTLFKAMLSNKMMKDMDLSYLKYVVSGGDLVKDSLESDINDFLRAHGSKAKLGKGYGLSEAVAGATFAYNGYNELNSIGIPMVDTNIKIVDPETKQNLKENEIGEICISGPTVMKGYYKKEEETSNTLKDNWLHTGDLGYCDNGIFYFAQRKGNMIISSGVNVYPNNIEQVIEMHEAVAACAVIGIHHPYKMQVPKAYIILKEGHEASDGLKEEIDALCRKNLNIYSIPYSYEFREKLPQTLLGKISHKILEEETKEETKEKVYTRK